MSKFRCALIGALALGGVLCFPIAQAGPKKVKAHNAQTSHTFANAEQTPAHGLVVALSVEAEVVLDDTTGAAERFRNVRGNGSPQITMTNPTSPVSAAGGEDSSVELVFRSYKSKLSVKSWWWIDERGKRIGKKQKG